MYFFLFVLIGSLHQHWFKKVNVGRLFWGVYCKLESHFIKRNNEYEKGMPLFRRLRVAPHP